jgi:DNA gyrase subunit B
VLPLRGKILNVERARFDRMLSSAEVGTLITALGTGIGKDEYNPDKLRYHRIIIMTDADVDGSHIRTLLLTFFFRQMRPLIDRGHLYIAQPPLYRAKRGNEERYLKDDDALDGFLLDKALAEARFTFGSGEVMAGDELRGHSGFLRLAHDRLRRLGAPGGIPIALLEQAAILGALAPDENRVNAVAADLAARLNAVSLPAERSWVVSANTGGGLTMGRMVRGVQERYTLDAAAMRSAEARWLDRTEAIAHGPATAFERIIAQGRKGLSIQRFKGLGEMNPDQLWKTTLDPAVRTLLQVEVGDTEDAEGVFSTLMGDVVEPRREFIVGNALKVANLDV